MVVKYLILLLLIIGSVSAIDIQAGETINITLEKDYEYYSLVGNSSIINVNITQIEKIVYIYLGKYSKEDSFSIIFFDQEDKVINHYSSGGSRRTKKVYVDRNITNTEYIQNHTIDETEKPPIPKVTKDFFPYWIFFIAGISLGALIILLIFLKKRKHRVKRRLKK